MPQWLVGEWCRAEGNRQSIEYWVEPAGGLMLGLSRSVQGSDKTEFEFLRIEQRKNDLVYVAQPQGRPGVDFARVDGGENWIRFENTAHDFPQRIDYRRTGNDLVAEISGPGQGGKSMVIAFKFSRCQP
jgi:hypothetical protein